MIRMIALASLAFALGTCGQVRSADPIPPTVRLLVPAYFYPAGEGLDTWKILIQSAAKAPIVAIVNPGSGPGKRVDKNYSDLFQLSKNSRVTLIGYVTLSYAKRPLSAVRADVDKWLQFYPEVRGIFFDEQPSDAEHADFARDCFAYARAKINKAVIVSNPGVVCAPEYLMGSSTSTVCVFEHHRGFENYRLPEWADAMKPHRFAVLHYGLATADDMRRTLQAAIQQRAGYIFLTDQKAPMPWGALPAYWQEELDEVIKINQSLSVPDIQPREIR
jgi:hypothetical protein